MRDAQRFAAFERGKRGVFDMSVLFLEDLAPGQKYRTGELRVTAEKIKAFAAEFDPQPFHLDDMRARDSIFHGLAASGWHTAGMTMRLLVESEFRPAGGFIGAGCEELRWPKPVRPDDVLHVECEVLEVRASKSRPEQGIVKMRNTTFNQHGEPVQIFVVNQIVQRRVAADA